MHFFPLLYGWLNSCKSDQVPIAQAAETTRWGQIITRGKKIGPKPLAKANLVSYYKCWDTILSFHAWKIQNRKELLDNNCLSFSLLCIQLFPHNPAQILNACQVLFWKNSHYHQQLLIKHHENITTNIPHLNLDSQLFISALCSPMKCFAAIKGEGTFETLCTP